MSTKRTKPTLLTILLAVAIGMVLLQNRARCGDCCDFRPFWFSLGQPIPCGAEQCGGRYTLNPFRFAHRTHAPTCCYFAWQGFHSSAASGRAGCGCEREALGEQPGVPETQPQNAMP